MGESSQKHQKKPIHAPIMPMTGVSRHGGIWDPDTTFRAASNAAGHITVLQPEQYRMMARAS